MGRQYCEQHARQPLCHISVTARVAVRALSASTDDTCARLCLIRQRVCTPRTIGTVLDLHQALSRILGREIIGSG